MITACNGGCPCRTNATNGAGGVGNGNANRGFDTGGGCDGNSVVKEPWAGVTDISGGDDEAFGGGLLAPAVGTDVVDDCDMVCIMDDVVDDHDKLVVAPMADDEVKDLMPRGRQKGQKFSAPRG